ncbi:iron complex outermembrane receptor protein [Pseudomonas sp. BIGb0408]|uniref:Iron complex outermembrane receptor protein n=1 Tax=Phytopseudomonas flavescens TaxID=29435 RepID=A0A7Z0BP87_9GAMM|nr:MULTISPECIES: TonB-dependent receptor [Pseudomonas]MCW2293556.1 iron complex outermembrane receptor protein [Pseudomonas sp. BIGb0408]NYH71873.1 iron complex outermembrane receptor protein [Pseudomonas flavescens]
MSRSSLFYALSGKSLRVGLVPCVLFAMPVQAAESDEPLALPSTAITGTADESSQPPDLHTPTTSGSRLGLTPLKTPASTSSLSGAQVRGRNNLTVQDAVTRTPGITTIGTPGNGGTALSARGFSGHASTMQLYDGTRQYIGAGTVTFPVDTWSVERLDVLRGPASVLYGEGATGAVINVIPKKPFTGEVRNQLRLGYGSDDRRQAALDSGGSLNDALSYRFTLNQQASNGWVDRGDSESLALSAALRWDASDDLSFTLSHDHADQQPMRYLGTPLVDGRFRESLRERNYNVADADIQYHDQITRLVTDWQISDTLSASNQLYYIKTQRYWRNAEAYRWQPGDLVERGDFWRIKHTQEQVGDRQSFTLDHPLFGLDSRSVVGVDYNRIRFARHHDFDNSLGDVVTLAQSGGGSYLSNDRYRPRELNQARQFSLFAENRTQLTERLSLVTGVRRDQVHIDRTALDDDSRVDRSLSGDNWRAGLVFELTPELSLYGQYATSTEGVSNLLTLSPTQQQFDLSEARQTEFGLKHAFWEGRGEWTLAAYHIVKEKLLSRATPAAPTEQIGQQSSDGLEATLELALGQGWQVSANAALVRAEYDDLTEAGGDRSGNRPTDVPRRTANLWLSKALNEQVEAGIGARYVDTRYADTANTVEIPGYTVVDANVAWQVLPEVRLGLELNNLFDRQYATTSSSDGEQWYLGQPRSFFVTADYSF